jgi:hypothetical protein
VVPATSGAVVNHQSFVPDTTVGGGFTVPNRISKEVAPVNCQLRFGEVVTPIVPFGGFGDVAAAGPAPESGEPVVVNVHTGPAVDPSLFLATICQ